MTKVHGAAIADLHAASATRTADVPGGDQDLVAMYIVRRGAWTLGGAPGHGDRAVSAGQFLVRHLGRLTAFETSADLTAKFLVLPPGELKPLLGNRAVTGPAESAEVRLLTALTDMIHTTVADLGPAGVAAAQGTLIELAKAVAKGRFDDVEPRLAPALTQAAKDLADRRLTDPELSPAMLARELNVSVRTLHRAFAAVGEPVGTYIRRRRLHEARLALAAPSRLSVSSRVPSRSTSARLPPSTPVLPKQPRSRRTSPRRATRRPKAPDLAGLSRDVGDTRAGCLNR
ncbi:helix-turn-helix domain-containing protein [Streptomyces echinatus]|uniref:helix-turn-helix domain-containing protein n=1 Tax=Streptomyces echinatus TaxID=67293 RepID=UPI0031E909AB